jgi:integrase
MRSWLARFGMLDLKPAPPASSYPWRASLCSSGSGRVFRLAIAVTKLRAQGCCASPMAEVAQRPKPSAPPTKAPTAPRYWTIGRRRNALALERAGLDKEGTFYALRHSYISRAIEGEVPLNIIGDNCGTSIRRIETTYAKILVGKRREFIERGAPSLGGS